MVVGTDLLIGNPLEECLQYPIADVETLESMPEMEEWKRLVGMARENLGCRSKL